jgi:ABC-type phosphate/phosphonate transport system substrate-binding protein
MIAALQMYDFDDLVAVNDRLWAVVRGGLRARGIAAPDALTRGADLWDVWHATDLLLSQTCGYPYRAKLHPDVTLVGTPDYGVEGCAPGEYCSYFIARADDPRRDLAAFDTVPLAYSDALSQSGWAAPQNHAASLGLCFPAGLMTGAHRLTMQAIADGRAEFGAVDAVTWRHLLRVDPTAQKLRIIAQTKPTPGLPLITAKGGPADDLRDVIQTAISQMSAQDRNILGLKGLTTIPPQAYLAVPNPPPPDQIG